MIEAKNGVLDIVVVGTGMYACGRGTDGFGTIMPAIFEWKRKHNVGTIYIVGRSGASARAAGVKIRNLGHTMGLGLSVKCLPKDGTEPLCYKRVMREAARPACAIVAVPDRLHNEVAAAAIENGLHTLVVKPLVATVRDVRELVKLQEKKGVYCAVEFHKRLDDANLILKDTIEKGAIGDPLYFLAEFSQRKSMPTKIFKKWAATTNIFQYLGIHYVDMIYFATGAVPLRAMAVGQKNWLVRHGIDTYDSIEAMTEWKAPSGNRFISCIVTDWVDPEQTSAMSDQKIKVIGTKGRFESDQKNRGISIVTDALGSVEPNPYFCYPRGRDGRITYSGYGIDSIHQFLSDALAVDSGDVDIEDLEACRPTFRQSIAPTEVLEAVNKSLSSGGKWITIRKV